MAIGKVAKKFHILYCSAFISCRTHRELVRLARAANCIITELPWHETHGGTYVGPSEVDGIISHLDNERGRKLCLKLNNIPNVSLNAAACHHLGLPGAVMDHIAAGRMVAHHYLDLAFTNFAAFVDSLLYDSFNHRLQGFSEVITNAGYPEPKVVSFKQRMRNNPSGVLKRFGEALKSSLTPIAIMASNDKAAVQIMEACRRQDLSIPAQVAICGFDNDPLSCDVAPIPLSSVDTNPERQAREAFNLLLSLMNGAKPPDRPIIIPPERLVVRRSSGLRAEKSQLVAKALAYIHEHAWKAHLDIPEVAQAVGTSRTSLFRTFRNSLQVTPLQYLTQLRIEKAQRLLKETNLKINAIRPQCGFASDYQMYQAFKRTEGASPQTFRYAKKQDF